ncbi:AAA family ATPase [Campylobacter coli]|nr:AAA domain-containing protein [Campylobacter coli]EIP4520000.1 AAA family ATPase [Campylobacter coli]MBT2220038.1 AAA family ATPase [Campylobacter coli]
MIEFLNEDRKKLKEYLIDFFHNAYNSDKLSSKDEIVNFDFLKSYGFCVKLSYGKGTISKIPWIIFIRTDTQEYKASYGVYVYCGIKRENGEIIVCIGESEDKTINYLAKNKVDKYNTRFNYQVYNYSNLSNDIDLIVDKIILNMQWFEKLPLNEIQDINNNIPENKNSEIENDTQQISSEMENKNIPLNQILYGPPGTGKTYHTIDKALEILGENLESRDEKKAKFDEYVKNGQIVFTTFHQSYGYEEFVEGIKPIMDSEKGNSKEIEYEIKDGIFKELYKRALNKEREIAINKDEGISVDKNSKVWKISLGSKGFLREECFKENKICIGWHDIPKYKDERFLNLGSNDKNSIISFVEYMQIGDLVCVFNTSETIKGIGVIASDVKYSGDKEYQTYREIRWISQDEEINILDLNNGKILVQKTVYRLYRISSNDLLERINQLNNLKIVKDNTKEKFIIIIDEINRGNVSKIFGELITLIEPSKRIGEKEELKVRLPYSGDEFGVPKNVYILGTMNTADRSITSLDTALRRRFEFIEMMPDVSKLSNNCEGVDLQKLLEAINARIEYLLDREKTIGHAFFIDVENLEDLKKVFQNKIIPLLQEYFYNDYALISAVLNDNGMIEKCEKDDKYLQKIKNLDNVDSEKIIYNIASFDNEIWNDIKTYQAIYNDGENQSKNDKQ